MNRTLLILAGALIAAGVAFFYVYSDTYIEEETGGVRVLVVTAARDIAFGEPVQATWLELEELPQAYVEDRHLRAADLRQLIGLPLAQSVRAGEAVLRTDLSAISDQQRTLSADIPQGMRALSIEAQQESSHAGLLRPGDRVDVLLIVGDHRVPDSGRTVVVAQNLLVLSFGREIESDFDESRHVPTNFFTAQVSLEVDLEDAQRLTLARRQGQMRILLRNPNDASQLEDPPEVFERELLVPENRQAWLRRFALVQAPPPPGSAPDPIAPPE